MFKHPLLRFDQLEAIFEYFWDVSTTTVLLPTLYIYIHYYYFIIYIHIYILCMCIYICIYICILGLSQCMIAAIRPLSSFFGAVDNQTRGCAGIQCGHWKSPHSIHWILVYHHFPVKQMVTEFCPFLVSSEVWRLCGAVVDDRSHQASWEHGCDMNGSKTFKLPCF